MAKIQFWILKNWKKKTKDIFLFITRTVVLATGFSKDKQISSLHIVYSDDEVLAKTYSEDLGADSEDMCPRYSPNFL